MSIIKNINKLATSKLRKDALDILEEGYQALVTSRLINSKIRVQDGNICLKGENVCLNDFENIYLIAVGKCAVSSAKVFEELLGDKITEGIVLDVKNGEFKYLLSEAGTHPLPSEKNIFVTNSIINILKKATKKDLVLALISGGGSSLMFAPYETDYKNQIQFIDELMKKGASIHELNIVRKHISQIKGGQFAKFAYPSRVVSVILSDVPGDDLSVVASGPTVIDKSTIKDAETVLEKYEMIDFAKLLEIKLHETPKEKKYFEKVDNILLGSNKVALEAMKQKAEELGYNTYIEDTKLEGEARMVGKNLISKEYLPLSCHLWGGETTVRVKNNQGMGGRNQEFVLGALPYIKDRMVVIGAASDGWDNSNIAGAIADYDLYAKVLDEGIDCEKYLEENNSYNFFKQVGGHIDTGRTGSNVADLYMVLVGEQGILN